MEGNENLKYEYADVAHQASSSSEWMIPANGCSGILTQ